MQEAQGKSTYEHCSHIVGGKWGHYYRWGQVAWSLPYITDETTPNIIRTWAYPSKHKYNNKTTFARGSKKIVILNVYWKDSMHTRSASMHRYVQYNHHFFNWITSIHERKLSLFDSDHDTLQKRLASIILSLSSLREANLYVIEARQFSVWPWPSGSPSFSYISPWQMIWICPGSANNPHKMAICQGVGDKGSVYIDSVLVYQVISRKQIWGKHN